MTRITVAGASGLVGSNIVREALKRGYHVSGTLRDAEDTGKTRWLMALPGAPERLTLFSADSRDSHSFDAAMAGSDAVFIACFPPLYRAADGTPARELDRQRGYEEIVRPVRDGCLNVLAAAERAGIGSVMLCSSTSSTNPPVPLAIKTEATALSDAEHQMAQGKFTAAEKIVMETAAQDFCVAHNLRLCIFLPTMMLGPVVMPQHLEGGSHRFLVAPIRDGRAVHDTVPEGSISVSHVGDVAALFLNAYERPEARGRYFAVYESLDWADLYAEFARQAPGAEMPPATERSAEPPTQFDFTRRDALGVTMRDIPTTIAETARWLKSQPFG
ncbi:nucleoside-diphosphate-sugar epimerase [Kushneria sinocarnis]|uniref:Nucleoside-diphosphate-sugar epimerase n=1 Tax=Kushneria sinocarnis TaxID=595502 RepID=A0A420WZK6_9GAMM|nr:NAD(P)H-binding protein [Kushneria sinocarnis]RKR06710.1 nucleoside-diphosphate-sugar epimerase [Kushneria sinocarnis]